MTDIIFQLSVLFTLGSMLYMQYKEIKRLDKLQDRVDSLAMYVADNAEDN